MMAKCLFRACKAWQINNFYQGKARVCQVSKLKKLKALCFYRYIPWQVMCIWSSLKKILHRFQKPRLMKARTLEEKTGCCSIRVEAEFPSGGKSFKLLRHSIKFLMQPFPRQQGAASSFPAPWTAS